MKKFLTMIALIGITALGCSAAPIGILDIAGTANIFVSATAIDFGPPGGGTGTFVVTGATQAFTVLVPGFTQGTITDLTAAGQPAGPPLAVPLNPFVNVPVVPRFVFNLEQIFLGGGPSCVPAPAVGRSCSPIELVPNTPFLLTQNTNAVGGSMSVRGTVTDVLDGTSTPYTGLFTFNVTAYQTIPQVLSVIASGGTVQSSWSAEFNTVPEPSPLATLLSGLSLVLCGFWRKKKA